MTRALLIVSYQQLRLFVPKTVYYYACIALFSFKLTFVLYSSNVVVCLDKKITGRHQLITPPLPPRLSANEVSKAFACIVPSSRTPLLQAAFIRVDLHLLAARPAISPDKSSNHKPRTPPTSHCTRLLHHHIIITILCAPTKVARVICYFGAFGLFCAHPYRQTHLHLQE
jgi:hypothetical protein